MESVKTLDGILFAKMICAGAANLKAHVQEVNDLNVFPIPDGDTGDNMLLTMLGGVEAGGNDCDNLSEASRCISGGMLLSARGNSGVILSQFFDGMTCGFSDVYEADAEQLGKAFQCGVQHAYQSVMTPTEGTILTVIREATDYACQSGAENSEDFLDAFITEAKASLERTPELLAVLKKAGVVDSGGAGLIYIVEGMNRALHGDGPELDETVHQTAQTLDLDAFTEDSVLEFGYCTEVLLRLQNAKTNIAEFRPEIITDYLQTIGDSIVAVKNGSIVKIHVHTMTPDKVLAYGQQFGEFLKIKIENMSLQHNNIPAKPHEKEVASQRKTYGVVAVAAGEGLKQLFLERGADVVVDGGQSMNPSAEAFLEAFDEVNADTIFVFPNNGNIVLTAKQAAGLYTASDVRVIESHTIGDGYASLSMLDTGSQDTDQIVAELTDAMEGVITAEISHCVRDASMDGLEVHTGDYIGFVGKELLAVHKDRFTAVCQTTEKLHLKDHDICILIRGKDSSMEESDRIESYVHQTYPGQELYVIDGMQEVYDYILIIE